MNKCSMCNRIHNDKVSPGNQTTETKIQEIKKLIEAKLPTCRRRVEDMNWHGVAGAPLMIESKQLELMESVMAIIDSQL